MMGKLMLAAVYKSLKMSSCQRSDMKIPSRPAPPPPSLTCNGIHRSSTLGFINSDRDLFSNQSISRSASLSMVEGGRKEPPPRPPPPTAGLKSSSRKQAPGQKLIGLFGRGNKSRAAPEVMLPIAPPTTFVASGTLIDFSSPPSSPTLTAHSSSDGFSVDSFSSDSFPLAVNSGGSQVESGFEDDFDFVLGPGNQSGWGDPGGPVDPFSPSHRPSPDSNLPPTLFELSNHDPRDRQVRQTLADEKASPSGPTIIRAKNKPPRPPPLKQPLVQFGLLADWSPPMPTMPPPPPPPELLDVLANGPQIPPRPTALMSNVKLAVNKSYCIAEYDYEATHPDDLFFKASDVISLTRRVSADWLGGRLHGREGIFPASYVRVMVPLGEVEDNEEESRTAIALFSFTPQTWDDLPFQEGERVCLLRRVNDDWWFGECNGRRGQFPASFVSDLGDLSL